MKKNLKISLLLLLIITLVSSCHRKQILEKEKKTAPQQGGSVIIGIRTDPETLNPLLAVSQLSYDIISLIFNKLADINEDLRTFHPRLAKSWEFSKDSLSIIFHLHTNVFWHDSVRFTSKDVIFTHKLQTNPEIGWNGITYKTYIASVEAPDDSTVIYHFRKRYNTMLMDAVEGYIVPEHLLKDMTPSEIRNSKFGENPVGTGPFVFKRWDFQQSITLVRNQNYYEENKPYLDKVIFKILPDERTIFNELRNREIDMAYYLSQGYYVMLEKLSINKRSHIKLRRILGRRYDFIGWNLYEPDSYITVFNENNKKDIKKIGDLEPHRLFSSQRVRAALTMAINREEIRKVVLKGLARAIDGPIPPIWPVYNDTAVYKWEYNPEKAKEILKEEGWIDEDGDNVLEKGDLEFSFEIYTNAGNTNREQAVTIIQDQLSRIGVKVIPKIVEPAYLFGYILPTRQYDAALIGWGVGLKVYLTPLFHSKTFFFPFHFTGYFSKEYDYLEDMALSAMSYEESQKYWNKISRKLSYELPYTWLYYEYQCIAIDKRYKNTKFDVRGAIINIEDWWIPVGERLKRDRF
ncbi:MAG: hypothetical protein H0Z29_09370 [Candidatus Marinimicrobia bacterium]|nr:hypothetical protein [Candidatus Neomarinimicrobiota bacterium]